MEDDIEYRYVEQAVSKVERSKERLIISGTLGRYHSSESVPYSMTLEQVSSSRLAFTITVDSNQVNRVILTGTSSEDEQFFGFGSQFSYINMKGRRVPVMVSEQGVGRGDQPITLGAELTAGAGGKWHSTYAPIPWFLTTKLRAMLLDNDRYSEFDMTSPGRVSVTLFHNTMKGHLMTGSSPLDILEEFTSITGRMKHLPGWVTSGAILGLQGGTDRVLDIYNKLKKAGTPIAGLWLQDWVGQRTTSFGKQLWWNWTLDKKRYPRWNEFRTMMDQQDVKLLAYINPCLVDTTGMDGRGYNYFKEGVEKGYFIKNDKGEPFLVPNTDFSAGMLDVTNPEARKWYQDIIEKEIIGAGFTGWMADYGEAFPLEAKVYSQEPGEKFHNSYPVSWARLNYEVVSRNAGLGKYMFFSRSGYTRSPAYSTLFWLGDQLVSWGRHDGIKTVITGLISSGMSGYTLNHSDIGGFTTINNPIRDYHRSRELLFRWIELAAFTPVFRTHEGSRPGKNHQFYSDAQSIEFFARFARVYMSWSSYRQQCIQEAAEKGYPVIRHPFLHYPGEKQFYGLVNREFMVGKDMVVVPVLDKETSSVEALLPPGEWIHLWSDRKMGNLNSVKKVTVDTPMGQPAVFLRKGSPVHSEMKEKLKSNGIL